MLPFHHKYQYIPAMFDPNDPEDKHTFKSGDNKNRKKRKIKLPIKYLYKLHL
jgi:hypothetical protein